MRINDDFSRPLFVDSWHLDWKSSPASGVERRMLFRIGDEVAQATSIVRYAPQSAFPRHTHRGGEEFLVLAGVFKDERGDYGEGAYIRNPPGTAHAPASEHGCTIFVRLWQFRRDDSAHIVRHPGEGLLVSPPSGARSALILFDDGHEQVRMEEYLPAATVTVANLLGLEFFLFSGSLTIDGVTFNRHAWGRLPQRFPFIAEAGPEGARIWMKQGPLCHHDACTL
ncbi:MAG: cupin domain-containing protein [Proteobacteria bacterium]|nr:cupin domain-containing protein [Pseudomonadota bacterium]